MSFYQVLRSTVIPVDGIVYGKKSYTHPTIVEVVDAQLHEQESTERILAQNIAYILQNFPANSRYLVAIILETQGYGYQGATIWEKLEQRIYSTALFSCDSELNETCCFDYEIQMILLEMLAEIRFTYDMLSCLRQDDDGTMDTKVVNDMIIDQPGITSELMSMLKDHTGQDCSISEIMYSFQGKRLTQSDRVFVQNTLSITAHLLQKSLHLDRPALFARIIDQVKNSYGKNNTAPEHIVEEYIFEFLKEVYFPTDDE